MPWTRVKDKTTGHEYSVLTVNEDNHQVLDKPAADRFDRPYPPKHNVTKDGKPAAGSKEASK